MSVKKTQNVAAGGRRQWEETTRKRGAGQRCRASGRRPLATLAALAAMSMAAVAALHAPGRAQERFVGLSAQRSVQITAGKTQDVRVDAPLSDVVVGDPEVADVTPLTDHSLSMLGKKIGNCPGPLLDFP